ncbi:MAG: beta-galactosidase trimerization domain-containing protein, partial [Anaerolineaceae bacterium]|nr:beta-galactosidase trimerization domain-containing protein [Anaerolineaceae bacterium]
DWKVKDTHGRGIADDISSTATHRAGLCCVNSPYRDYTRDLTREICESFDVEGIRMDMTFWPRPCYCRHCRRRYNEEVGGEIPEIVNWEDPRWVAFQRCRERWMAEFAERQTQTALAANPGLSVEHQASSIPHEAGWRFGVDSRLALQNTYLQGDFYGGTIQGSLVRKLFYNLSPNRPVGFETCVSTPLANYPAIKSPGLLEPPASSAIADGCAFIYITSIDPVGTLEPTTFERMGEIWGRTQRYEPHVGGELQQDVAVYYSLNSKCNWADNGKHVEGPGLAPSSSHTDAVVGACRALRDQHIPFGVITDTSLDQLSRHKVIILPDVLMMNGEEVSAFRDYVRQGGKLYASRNTSLVTRDGHRQNDFMLADVFGVHFSGETAETFTYLAPVEATDALFAPATRRHPAGLAESQLIVRANEDLTTLATITLPYTVPADAITFTSLHNDPPGFRTAMAGIVRNEFGSGSAIYVTSGIERHEHLSGVFLNLVRELCDDFSFEADAPPVVEVTLFDQPDRSRLLANLVNFQDVFPQVPIHDARLRLALEGRKACRAILLPDGEELEFEVNDGMAEIAVPRFETFAMLALEYE